MYGGWFCGLYHQRNWDDLLFNQDFLQISRGEKKEEKHNIVNPKYVFVSLIVFSLFQYWIELCRWRTFSKSFVMQAFFHVMAIISGILTSVRAIRSLHLTTLPDVKMLQSTFPSRGRQPPRQTNIRARRALETRWLRWFQFRKCSRRGYPGQQHMTKKAISLKDP